MEESFSRRLCKVNNFQELTKSRTNLATRDLISIFVAAMQLIERQYNLIINERVHVDSSDVILLQLRKKFHYRSERLRIQEGIMKAKEVSDISSKQTLSAVFRKK